MLFFPLVLGNTDEGVDTADLCKALLRFADILLDLWFKRALFHALVFEFHLNLLKLQLGGIGLPRVAHVSGQLPALAVDLRPEVELLGSWSVAAVLNRVRFEHLGNVVDAGLECALLVRL